VVFSLYGVYPITRWLIYLDIVPFGLIAFTSLLNLTSIVLISIILLKSPVSILLSHVQISHAIEVYKSIPVNDMSSQNDRMLEIRKYLDDVSSGMMKEV